MQHIFAGWTLLSGTCVFQSAYLIRALTDFGVHERSAQRARMSFQAESVRAVKHGLRHGGFII